MTRELRDEALAAFEQHADSFDADPADVDHTPDLRAVAEAADAVSAAQARLTEAVVIARAQGRSWTRIAIALGVSRQAARQRYARLVDA